jgi:hypothetical protein
MQYQNKYIAVCGHTYIQYEDKCRAVYICGHTYIHSRMDQYEDTHSSMRTHIAQLLKHIGNSSVPASAADTYIAV